MGFVLLVFCLSHQFFIKVQELGSSGSASHGINQILITKVRKKYL